MVTQRVGKRINELWYKLGIIREELADRENVYRVYIASLEEGKRNISIITLEKIVDALGVFLSEFLFLNKYFEEQI